MYGNKSVPYVAPPAKRLHAMSLKLPTPGPKDPNAFASLEEFEKNAPLAWTHYTQLRDETSKTRKLPLPVLPQALDWSHHLKLLENINKDVKDDDDDDTDVPDEDPLKAESERDEVLGTVIVDRSDPESEDEDVHATQPAAAMPVDTEPAATTTPARDDDVRMEGEGSPSPSQGSQGDVRAAATPAPTYVNALASPPSPVNPAVDFHPPAIISPQGSTGRTTTTPNPTDPMALEDDLVPIPEQVDATETDTSSAMDLDQDGDDTNGQYSPVCLSFGVVLNHRRVHSAGESSGTALKKKRARAATVSQPPPSDGGLPAPKRRSTRAPSESPPVQRRKGVPGNKGRVPGKPL